MCSIHLYSYQPFKLWNILFKTPCGHSFSRISSVMANNKEYIAVKGVHHYNCLTVTTLSWSTSCHHGDTGCCGSLAWAVPSLAVTLGVILKDHGHLSWTAATHSAALHSSLLQTANQSRYLIRMCWPRNILAGQEIFTVLQGGSW